MWHVKFTSADKLYVLRRYFQISLFRRKNFYTLGIVRFSLYKIPGNSTLSKDTSKSIYLRATKYISVK